MKGLLVIDIQNFYEKMLVNFEIACKNAYRIIEKFRKDNSPIFYIQHIKKIPLVNKIVDAGMIKSFKIHEDKIEKIKKRISSHKEPMQISNGTNEQICLSNADAMAFISKPIYWLYFTFEIDNFSLIQSREWMINKMESSYQKLISPAKKIIKKDYIENIKLVREK